MMTAWPYSPRRRRSWGRRLPLWPFDPPKKPAQSHLRRPAPALPLRPSLMPFLYL